ncbi:MAG: hypothetical protein RL693_2725 [Verrucomicrobiota bacterium]
MYLMLGGLYQAKWSALIHEEWINAILRKRPDLKRTQLERVRSLMDACALDSLVSDFDDITAAIKSKAQFIITYNLKHFPTRKLQDYHLEALTPDDFVIKLLSANPQAVRSGMLRHRASLKHPPKTAEEYLETLDQQRLPKTVLLIRQIIDEI